MSKFKQAWGSGAPSIAGASCKLQTSVGRPVDPEWAAEFQQEFTRLAPGYFSLRMRRLPGVVYVAEGDYNRWHSNEYEGEKSEVEAFERIKNQVKAWCLKGVLDATAQESIHLDRYQEVGARHRRGNIHASAMVHDTPDFFYPGGFGFLLTGERQAIRRELDLSRTQQNSMQDIPKLQIGLGEIYSTRGPVPRSFMQEVDALMAQTIELGPVGPLRGIH